MAHRMRRLKPEEIALARTVYRDSVPYDRVFISDLRIGNTAVTLAGMNTADHRFIYRICWPEAFDSALLRPGLKATLIHELCHVWQGHHGTWPTFYMGQSIVDQVVEGMEDIWRKREYRRWDEHRAGAYTLHGSDWGKKWSSFGVEQQASLVESWYLSEKDHRTTGFEYGPGVTAGGLSEIDPRFPYIRDVIRPGKRDAPYRALTSFLSAGGDIQIKALQDKLVALGYLESRHADGFVGRSRSATLDAIAAFQRANGLNIDRDLGGTHSKTRAALAKPLAQLVQSS